MSTLLLKEKNSEITTLNQCESIIKIGNNEHQVYVSSTSDKIKTSCLINKKIFDVFITLLTSPIWIPAIFMSCLALLICSGWPILYISRRRIFKKTTCNVIKFRTMIRNADELVNRDTLSGNHQSFLNIPINSNLYTPIGRFIEKICFTELPQLLYVLVGHMSLVGNRPLPENVIAALKTKYNFVEDRFSAKCGVTGPIQLIGRENISDADRLEIEIRYCHIVHEKYSMRLDFIILLYTVLTGVKFMKPLSASKVSKMLKKYSGG